MDIANISGANHFTAVNRTSAAAPTAPVLHRERPRDDRKDDTQVVISERARKLSEAESLQNSSRKHVERIQDLNLSDQRAQTKMEDNAAVESRALEAKQKIDEELYKRINTHA